MNELKARLSALGLSDEQVDQILDTVAGFVKERVPQDCVGVIDDLLEGRTPDLGRIAGGLMGKMGGFFK